MSNPSAVILIWHGSRDPRAAAGFEQLVRDCQTQLSPVSVWGCQLECTNVSLADQLNDWVRHQTVHDPTIAARSLEKRAIAVPVFIGAGVHVSEDIPAAIAAFCQQHPSVDIQTLPPLGNAPELVDVLHARCTAYPEIDAWILWGHGSRLPAMAQGLARTRQHLAARLPNCPIDLAFWSQSPNWEEAVDALAEQGYERIGILPCFWFVGGLIDRLNAEWRAWQSRHVGHQVIVADVLTPHPLWIGAVARQVNQARQSDSAVQSVA